MIQKKICMLGSFAVGKTSLVSRFVQNMFSDKYLTTVGAKINQKVLLVDGEELQFILWDLYGEDDIQKTRTSYLKGCSGYLLVADGTRPASLEVALQIYRRNTEMLGELPFMFIINKADLTAQWEIDDESIETLKNRGWPVIKSSAKTGLGVEEAFSALARKILSRR